MKEKGGHFVRASAIALAAHALLFLVFAQLIRGNAVGNPGLGLVEIQLSGDGDGSGGGGVAGRADKGVPGPPHAPKARPAPVLAPAPSRAPASTPSLSPSPAPSLSPSTSSPVQSPAAAAPIQTPASTPAEQWPPVPGPEGGRGAGTGSNPTAVGAGGGSGGWGGGSGGGPMGGFPATIADIDAVPLQPIAAPYPARAKRLDQQGLVKVRVDIDDQGIVVEDQVIVSSGFADLDNAALDAVRRARFLPGEEKRKIRAVTLCHSNPVQAGARPVILIAGLKNTCGGQKTASE